ncbi:MAG: hypothetical protein WBG57_03160 [Ornithinimicrobium sp.]
MSAPADWQVVEAGPIVFRVPPELVEPGGPSVDSAAGTLESEVITVTYDVGRFGPDLDQLAMEHQVLTTERRRVAGHTGTEMTFRPAGEPFELARLLQLALGGGQTATVRVSCRAADECRIADTVFDSIALVPTR